MAESPLSTDLPAPRVLIVDDDLATRLLASESLLAAGFECDEAEDGAAALAHYASFAPDALLLDIHMPELDGYDVCRRIRALPGGQATSIMVMTASDDVDAVQRAFAAGATDFLTKPLNLPLLAHRVRYMLRAAATAITARETAARLARAQRLARLVHWQLGPDGRFAWASDPLAVFCPHVTADPGRDDSLLALVHPEDRARVAAVLEARSEHQLAFRLRCPDGSERTVQQDAAVEQTDRGPVLIGATQDITDAARAAQQIAQLAFYDDVTGIPNGQMAERYLRAADPAVPRAAIAIELGIGRLERLAGPARDALVRAATARVIDVVRGSDLRVRLDQAPCPPEELTGPVFVARTGPDELLVVTTAVGGAPTTARRIADAIAAPLPSTGRDVALVPRLGLACFPDVVEDLRRLPTHATEALHEADRAPARDIVIYTAASRDRRTRNAELAARLGPQLAAEAAEGCELAVDYLPRVDHGTRTLIGVRARPRWPAVPGDLPTLEAIGAADPALRDRIALWTLRAAIRDAGVWRLAGCELRLSVELPQAVVVAATFPGLLQRALADADVAPRVLDIELTDIATTDEALARTAAAARVLRARGVRVCTPQIDDSCNLRVLRRLPLDGIRLSRATLDRLGPSFLGTVVAVARALDLAIAASEIDSPAALAALEPHALDEVSGGWAGEAVPASRVPRLDTPTAPPGEPLVLPQAAPARATLVT